MCQPSLPVSVLGQGHSNCHCSYSIQMTLILSQLNLLVANLMHFLYMDNNVFTAAASRSHNILLIKELSTITAGWGGVGGARVAKMFC